MLHAGDPKVRAQSARQLRNSLDQPLAIAALGEVAGREDEEATVKRAVFETLAKAGPRARPVATKVAQYVVASPTGDGAAADTAALDAATVALLHIQPPPEALNVLSPLLAKPERRSEAEFLFGEARPEDVLPVLMGTYAKSMLDAGPRASVARVLAQPTVYNAQAEALLLTILRADAAPAVRAAAAEGLWRGKHDPAGVRRALVAAFNGERERIVRAAAASALAKLGPAEGLQTEPLLDLLRNGSPNERVAAAQLLAIAKPAQAAEVLTTLLRMADNDNPFVRWSAAMALGNVDPHGERSGPAIVVAVLRQDQAMLDRLLRTAKLDEATRRRIKAIAEDEKADPGVRTFARKLAH